MKIDAINRSMLMTACDLGAVTRPWKISKQVRAPVRPHKASQIFCIRTNVSNIQVTSFGCLTVLWS